MIGCHVPTNRGFSPIGNPKCTEGIFSFEEDIMHVVVYWDIVTWSDKPYKDMNHLVDKTASHQLQVQYKQGNLKQENKSQRSL